MDRSWKVFIKIVAALLSVIIVCVAINVSVNKVTAGITDMGSISGENGQNGYNDAGQNQGYVQQKQDAGMNTDMDSNDLTNGGSAVVPNQNGSQPVTPSANGGTGGSQGAGQQNGENPLSYNSDKAKVIAYYNKCLRNSYSQAKVNDHKIETVTIGVDSVKINNSEAPDLVKNTANSIASKNQKNINETKSFANGRASDGTAVSTYVLPANLTASGARSAKITQNGSGYRVVIVIVAESSNFTSMPPHNSACAWPLKLSDVTGALDSFADITAAKFYYPGTQLTANIDSSGKVTYVQVNMPLTVTDGTGVIKIVPFKGTEIKASAHGEWVVKHTLSF